MQKLLMNHVLIVLNAIFICGTALAGPRYVVEPGTIPVGGPGGTYETWETAATQTQVQWAVNVAAAGETVWVSNGTYNLTNQINFTNGITVRSVNGREAAIINGNYPDYNNRCFLVTNANAFVQGFTITNGFVWGNGGGVYLKNGATVRDCLISGNTARDGSGGGVLIDTIGTVDLCSVVGNVSTGTVLGGGGIFLSSGGTATNSTIAWNLAVVTSAPGYYAGGGGVFLWGSPSLVQNCTLSSNKAQIVSGSGGWGGGGGAYAISGGTIINSIITGNTNNSRAGGLFTDNGGAVLRNCLFINNQGPTMAGGICIYGVGDIQNCTIISNKGNTGGLAVWAYYNRQLLIKNCVIVSNYTFAGSLANWDIGNETTNVFVINTCTYPTNFTAGVTNIACISNNPAFVDYSAGNYRLAKDSPCVNRGTNQSWMSSASDLDGRMRIRYGIVDMGAYEAIHNATFFRFY